MPKFLMLSLGLVICVVTGCATTGAVKPNYVSPVQYQSFNCAELHGEYARINAYLKRGISPQKRTGLGIGLGFGLGLGRGGFGLIPNISVNMGQSSNSKRTEIANLYGQQDAIAESAKYKNCPIQQLRPIS